MLRTVVAAVLLCCFFVLVQASSWRCDARDPHEATTWRCTGVGNFSLPGQVVAPSTSLVVQVGFVGLPLAIQAAPHASAFFHYDFSLDCSFDQCVDQPPVCQVQTPGMLPANYFSQLPTELFFLEKQTGDPDCVHGFLSCQSVSCSFDFNLVASCLNCPFFFEYRWQ